MTNRTSLAIIIPMLLSTSNIVNALEIFNKNGNKLELYGRIHPNHLFSHGFLSPKIESHNDNTNSILGLSGKIKITDKLSSYATIEYKTDFFSPETLLHKHQTNTIRLGFAGLQYGKWGSIDYGRNYGIFHDVQSLTDHIPYLSKNSIFTYNDNCMVNRSSGLLTYRNDNIFGLLDGMSFAVQYQDKIDNNKEDNQLHNAGWGTSLKYETDAGLTAIGSYFSSKRSELNEDKNKTTPSVNAYGLGFKYNSDDIYIAAFYGAASNLTPLNMHSTDSYNEQYINKTENIEAVIEYNFASGFHPSLSYIDSKGQNSKVNNSNENNLELTRQINISTRYEFNKNISTYMNYQINLLKNENDFIKNHHISTENIIGAGIVYQF